jgi:hypothetical protein
MEICAEYVNILCWSLSPWMDSQSAKFPCLGAKHRLLCQGGVAHLQDPRSKWVQKAQKKAEDHSVARKKIEKMQKR